MKRLCFQESSHEVQVEENCLYSIIVHLTQRSAFNENADCKVKISKTRTKGIPAVEKIKLTFTHYEYT